MKKEILLSYFPKITLKRYQQLLAAFSNLENVWNAKFNDFKNIGWNENLIHEFLKWKNNLDEEKLQKILDRENIYCITKDDENYPNLLKQIYDPPLCLFVRGELNNDNFNLAVVGTRKFTKYGKQITEDLVSKLSTQGITIVSGLAFGIDAFAHNSAIDSGGKTIAVLGSGIDKNHIYPSSHKNLADKIIESGGAIISEYPPGTLPDKYTFPKRNRIVAGMSLGTLVIEAPKKSGALITSDCAIENNREVFVIPQNITSITSYGTNKLIKSGATCVTDYKDILDVLNLQDIQEYVTNKEILPDSPIEAKILEHILNEPIHIDDIIKKTNLPSQQVNSTLTIMEMKGKIKDIGNMNYIIIK